MSIYYTYIFATEDYKLNKSNQNPLCHSNSSPNLHVLCLQDVGALLCQLFLVDSTSSTSSSNVVSSPLESLLIE